MNAYPKNTAGAHPKQKHIIRGPIPGQMDTNICNQSTGNGLCHTSRWLPPCPVEMAVPTHLVSTTITCRGGPCQTTAPWVPPCTDVTNHCNLCCRKWRSIQFNRNTGDDVFILSMTPKRPLHSSGFIYSDTGIPKCQHVLHIERNSKGRPTAWQTQIHAREILGHLPRKLDVNSWNTNEILMCALAD